MRKVVNAIVRAYGKPLKFHGYTPGRGDWAGFLWRGFPQAKKNAPSGAFWLLKLPSAYLTVKLSPY
jgi:hypothetical protein